MDATAFAVGWKANKLKESVFKMSSATRAEILFGLVHRQFGHTTLNQAQKLSVNGGFRAKPLLVARRSLNETRLMTIR